MYVGSLGHVRLGKIVILHSQQFEFRHFCRSTFRSTVVKVDRGVPVGSGVIVMMTIFCNF
jgi:hypothetical protein